jgi:hypothetical protein
VLSVVNRHPWSAIAIEKFIVSSKKPPHAKQHTAHAEFVIMYHVEIAFLQEGIECERK